MSRQCSNMPNRSSEWLFCAIEFWRTASHLGSIPCCDTQVGCWTRALLQPLDYTGHCIPEDLGEALIKAVPGVKVQLMPCQTSSLGPAPAAQPGAVPALQAAAGGSRTQDMGTLSWMLPIPAEKPSGVGCLSIHLYIPCKLWVLLRFFPRSSLLGDIGVLTLVLDLFSI